jgi:hypothetical protein
MIASKFLYLMTLLADVPALSLMNDLLWDTAFATMQKVFAFQ